MTPRQIATNLTVLQCDVCGRTLLRGEHPAVFIAGGARRNVCELCTPRAAAEGWIREGVGDDALGVRERRRDRRGSLLARLRTRRDTHARPEPRAENDGHATGEQHAVEPTPVIVEEPRHVHAIPTNADMKRSHAVDLFNASDRPRTVAALARSLGRPFVTVRPSETEGSIVTIVIGWDLCWYRYEIDLADEAAGVRQTGQGDELSELHPADQVPNAAAGERGELQLVSG